MVIKGVVNVLDIVHLGDVYVFSHCQVRCAARLGSK